MLKLSEELRLQGFLPYGLEEAFDERTRQAAAYTPRFGSAVARFALDAWEETFAGEALACGPSQVMRATTQSSPLLPFFPVHTAAFDAPTLS